MRSIMSKTNINNICTAKSSKTEPLKYLHATYNKYMETDKIVAIVTI